MNNHSSSRRSLVTRTLLATTAGILMMLASGCSAGNPTSVENMTEMQRVACAFSQNCEVYWVEKGSVYHLCSHKDNNLNGILDADELIDANLIGAFKNGSSVIHVGSLEEAVAAGKYRLNWNGYSECGYDQNNPIFPACLEDAVNCQ